MVGRTTKARCARRSASTCPHPKSARIAALRFLDTRQGVVGSACLFWLSLLGEDSSQRKGHGLRAILI